MTPDAPSLQCPSPAEPNQTISMAHGAGGQMMQTLLQQDIHPLYEDQQQAALDAALITCPPLLAFSSDSFVVHPLEFPGGDIGKLAVYGTCNDLAMVGAKPLYLSLSFIIEEGLARSVWQTVLNSIHSACQEVGVRIIAGDTKVVERGKADQLFINTSGIGRRPEGVRLDFQAIQPGDQLIVSGNLGRHSAAVLAAREGFAEDAPIDSDCRSLYPLVAELLAQPVSMRGMRDLTRGGLAAALNEIARDFRCELVVDEAAIPLSPPVASLSELLGLDPLSLANEGTFLMIVPGPQAEQAVACLNRCPGTCDAAIIGSVATTKQDAKVWLRSPWGTHRPLLSPMGELLPRIC